MAKPKPKRLNVEIELDANLDEEHEVEVGVVGSGSGSAKLIHEGNIKRTKTTAGDSVIENCVPLSVPPEETKRRKPVS
jgi:microcompartment protein CcmK/EutM